MELTPPFQRLLLDFWSDNDTNLSFNTLRPRRNRRHFADDIFKCIFLNENVLISIKIQLKFIPKGPINSIPTLAQIMAWRRPGDKPLSEPMMTSSLTHIYASFGLNELMIQRDSYHTHTQTLIKTVRKRWRATAWCGKSKFTISSGWLKNGSLCHPDDIITLS